MAKIEYWHEVLAIMASLDERWDTFLSDEQDRKECIAALRSFLVALSETCWDVCRDDNGYSADEIKVKLSEFYTKNPLALFIPGLK